MNSLVLLIPALAVMAAATPLRVARTIAIFTVLLATALLFASDLWRQAIAYDLLRRPGYAATGAWAAFGLLMTSRSIGLAALGGLLGRAIIAFALVGSAALLIIRLSEADPFALEPKPFEDVHAILGLLGLGTVVAVGTSSLCAFGNGWGAVDFGAAVAAAVALLGPLYPGFGMVPAGGTGEWLLLAACCGGAAAIVWSVDAERTPLWVTVPLSTVVAAALPLAAALTVEEVIKWLPN